jgi:hypothetical protein
MKKELSERVKELQNKDFFSPDTHREILSMLELLYGIIEAQAAEIQALKDECNRQKGEKGKPDIKPNKKATEEKSDKNKMEHGTKREWKKGSKIEKIKIDREQIVRLDKTGLPKDIVFKGYEERVIQNIIMQTDNVLYRLEKYYSKSEGKTYMASLDGGLEGTEFGVETKALISTLYFENRVTENKITSFLNSNGLHISEGTVSNILTNEKSEELSEVKNEILKAGLEHSEYAQIDDTGMKISGKNGYATIVCNELFSAFFINFSKSRETVKSFLTAGLVALFIVLVGDDAPQFKSIAKRFALCWVHEERHYKKLNPIFDISKAKLKRVRTEVWDYYKKLAEYKKNPTSDMKESLWNEFDAIFGQVTEYEDLDKRLKLTLAKKGELLTVLDYPETPLHNNLSENGVRDMVMKRKISGGVKSDAGLKAWENNMSILATCKKLGVSYYEFMKGIFSGANSINLQHLIRLKKEAVAATSY